MDSTFFAQSAEILAAFHENREELDVLLDPKTGFAPSLSKICKKRLEEAKDLPQFEIDALNLEANTWDLLQILCSRRKTEQDPVSKLPTARELLQQNPYTPTATLAQSILQHSPLLDELVLVREWLHDTAPTPNPPEIVEAGYNTFTRLRLEQAERTRDKKDVEKLVTELDPDAPNREAGVDGKVLAANDANYEKALAQALYGYVRAGRLDEAVDICRRTRRSWRAASVRGSLLFEWRVLANQVGDNIDPSTFADGWSGNKRRKLWKTTCTRVALNPLLSDPERAMYAALAPSPSTSVVLKSSCKTWADHLWAHISIICEGKQVDALSRAGGGGGYWEGGFDSVERIWVEKSNSLGFDGRRRNVVQDEEREEAEWEREVISAIEALATTAVTEGPPASDPFQVSQLHVILNRTDKLLSDFAAGLRSGEFQKGQENFPALSRFFAHLCLYLRMIDMPVPADATQTILEVYLQVLEESGQRSHIALYASALGENAVERYALFLTSLDLSVGLEERRQALIRAEKHDLDIVRVARVTAEKTLEKAFAALPRMKMSLPKIQYKSASDDTDSAVSDVEWLLIRSLEWTTFQEQTYHDAVEHANTVFRYFFGCGNLTAAQALLHMLPSTQLKALRVPSEDVHDTDSERARMNSIEFMHYLQFFEIWDLFMVVREEQRKEAEQTTRGKKEEWIEGYKALIEEVREKVVELITTEWLISEEEVARVKNKTQRQITLVRIRRIYIPEIIIRLHTLLVESGKLVPRNLKYALELANIVADERYMLYSDFIAGGEGATPASVLAASAGLATSRASGASSSRLEEYLRAVRDAVLCALEGGGSDPLRILHVKSF